MPPRRLLHLLPLLGFLALVVWFAAGLGRDPHLVPSALILKPVPEFSLPPLPGFEHGLSRADLASGEPQILNVFASWCAPCRAEQPILMRLAREQGVTLRGLDYRDRPEDAVAWLAVAGNPYRSIGSDPANRVALDLGVYGAPESFVIDGRGVIRYKQVGPLTPEDVRQTILPLLASLKER